MTTANEMAERFDLDNAELERWLRCVVARALPRVRAGEPVAAAVTAAVAEHQSFITDIANPESERGRKAREYVLAWIWIDANMQKRA